ncbi:putative 11-S seed storage protein, plant [Helianthus annuus]|nr:putative 11-S seed storage protein, plant [Helianthus annuus]KAJ0700706.1 putative 11-S seed storage protein, plant [Helianthus annuus]KAJ0700710.1 putative 11-S seed storage protein, plant [Helianthus annuus]KAJ0884306.1 putative 11-S seed storage protein, plant [Helianthus annuus]KAJ0884307.1 putative 11-S seed storage protein, plant [Helianthus annuus]
MASKATLLLAFTLLFATCIARHQQRQQQQNQCQLQNIEALEPIEVIQAEAGVTEIWDAYDQQFQCAGVDFIRHRIQPGGLLLPSYVNTPILAFVERGRGIQGVILPGCPETYEYSQEQQFSGEGGRRGGGEGNQDRHQKVENLKEGDVVAIPTGTAHWLHNDGNTELVVVVFLDTQNHENQLDENRRRFFLAGNPQAQAQSQQQQQRQPRQQSPQRQRQRQRQGQGQNAGNIFNGFTPELIAQSFNVDQETAQKLQGQNDQRGHIVNVGQDLQIVRPPQDRRSPRQQQEQRRSPRQQQEQQQGRRGPGGGWSNGVEETICSMKFKVNIDNPSQADFVNPQAGSIANLNSFKFPILEHLRLSVERGELRPNAIQSPHWTINAHNLLYVTEGALRVQIVDNQGNSVFDNELREGQVVVIPQNFAVIKRANEQGSRWVSFKTNDNAMIANLAGRVSAISSMPVDVVANAYQLSREEAQQLKFSQRETVLFAPSFSRGQGIRASA